MDDFEDNRWKEKKITDFFRQVKPRPKSSWPTAPPHPVVIPPAAIPMDQFNPESHGDRRGHSSSHLDSEASFSAHDALTATRSSSAPNPTGRTSIPPQSIGLRDGVISPTIRSTRDSSCFGHGLKKIGPSCLHHCCSSTDPVTNISSQSQASCAPSSRQSASSHSTTEIRTNHSVSHSRPRKRFRKKVSGLFGENTDLHKRMTKLIQTTDMSKITVNRDAADADLSVRSRKPVSALFDTASLLATLPRESSIDSFDFVQLTSAAKRALGSPEKLETVKSSIGTLDPVHNQRFLDELDLGLDQTDCAKSSETKLITVQPPPLPSLSSPMILPKTRAPNPFPRSLLTRRRSVLAAIPAILRSKTRRAERGYRSKDVLRARLQAPKSGTERFTIVENPKSHLDIHQSHQITEETQRSRDNRKRPAEEPARDELISGYSQSVNDHNGRDGDSYIHESKKRRKNNQGPRVNEADLEASPVTLANSDRENDVDDRRIMQDPLTILVEAATGNCSLQDKDNDDVQVNQNRDVKYQRGS